MKTCFVLLVLLLWVRAAQSDRVIEFHASYGHHHNLRIPYIGRDMDYYGAGTCLFVASSSPDIYRWVVGAYEQHGCGGYSSLCCIFRVDLEEGRFMAPYTTASPAVNAVHVNPENQLLGAACEDGFVEAWDPRTHKAAARLQLPGDSDFEVCISCCAIAWAILRATHFAVLVSIRPPPFNSIALVWIWQLAQAMAASFCMIFEVPGRCS